ncbi:MAG TPA: hypothetical protein DCE56_06245 [Cyanobacteria bacterium UBA8553]|nr:hypothetical protein [Cyanobacteria bacterium UBA8553]
MGNSLPSRRLALLISWSYHHIYGRAYSTNNKQPFDTSAKLHFDKLSDRAGKLRASKQQTTNNKQQTTNNKQQTTNNKQQCRLKKTMMN